MNQGDENFFSMTTATHTVLVENKDAVSSIPAFVTAQDRMETLINQIKEEEKEILKNNKGVSSDKQTLKTEIAAVAYEVVGLVKTYANQTKNLGLLGNVNYTEKGLIRIRDEKFGPTIALILKKSNDNKVELKKHGLEQEDIDELTNLMDIWDGKKQSPRKAIVDRKTTNEKQDEHLDELEEILQDSCDNYANKLKRKFPEFYTKYTNARQVLNHGVRHKRNDNTPPPENPKV